MQVNLALLLVMRELLGQLHQFKGAYGQPVLLLAVGSHPDSVEDRARLLARRLPQAGAGVGQAEELHQCGLAHPPQAPQGTQHWKPWEW